MSHTEKENLYGVYVHIPYCKSKCSYCSFVSDTNFCDVEAYVDALIEEINERGRGVKADTVYIGGGTPSVLPKGMLSGILASVYECCDIPKDNEITVECNPDSATDAFFSECAETGVNRISIGLQSTDDGLLKNVGRIHNFAQFSDSLAAARKHGMENISVDLMLGLPSQTLRAAVDSVKRVIDLKPAHISLYGLSVEEGTPLFESGYTADEDLCADMYEECVRTLHSGGFFRYEVSNFARENRKCKHNIKYWNGMPYLGFGAAAHSFDGKRRTANTSDRAQYIAGNRISESCELTVSDMIEESIMLGLRTAKGIDLERLKNRLGYDLLCEKKSEIERLKRLALINVGGGSLSLTDNAYYKMNEIIISLI